MDKDSGGSSFVQAEEGLAQLLDDYLPTAQLQRGQVVCGTVLRVDPDAIVVDIKAKCEGMVNSREMDRLDQEFVERLKPGDKVMVYVVNPDEPHGEIVLSLVRARVEMDWQDVGELLEKKEVIEIEPISANRGGLIVQLGRLRGFVPASQLLSTHNVPRISDPQCVRVLEQLVGQKMRVQVIEADQERNRLILSERAAEAQLKESERVQFLASLRENEVRHGRVSNITSFGAFVDIGGLDGLVHLSELSWERVEHPSEVLQIGQPVDVYVLSVDQERQRIALSIKRLDPDPWRRLADRYHVGQLVECRVTRLTKWGAFACIVGDEAIEGLIHISELNDSSVDHPSDVVQQGDVMTLRILRVEPERHRLALSLRQVDETVAGDELLSVQSYSDAVS